MKQFKSAFISLGLLTLIFGSVQANPAYQTTRYQAIRLQTPTFQTPRMERTPVTAPTFQTPRFDAPIGATARYQTPVLRTQVFVGPRFQAGFASVGMVGMDFSDMYLPNPDDQFGAKSAAELAKQDMARFGLEKPVESPLEASLYPHTQTEIATTYVPPLPSHVYCLDNDLQHLE